MQPHPYTSLLSIARDVRGAADRLNRMAEGVTLASDMLAELEKLDTAAAALRARLNRHKED